MTIGTDSETAMFNPSLPEADLHSDERQPLRRAPPVLTGGTY